MEIKDLTNFEEIKASEASKVIGGICFPPPPPPPPSLGGVVPTDLIKPKV